MDCVHLPDLSLEELSRRLRKGPAPLGGGLELTQRCNLACVHCYCRLDAGDKTARAAEMSFEEICRIVDQAAEMGTFGLTLTGGEPLLRPDFLDVYNHVKSRGILPILFTNGTLITPAIADHLAEYPPFFVEVSVYGRTKDVYESITGVPGSYERCMQGIHCLLDRGVRVFLKTPAMKQNSHELDALARFAESLGSSFRFDVMLTPRLEHMDDRYGPYDHSLVLHDRVDLEFSDDKSAQAWASFSQRVAAVPRENTVYTCGAGLYAFFVDAYAHLTMCTMSRHPSYDLRGGTFSEGWALLRRTREEVLDDGEGLECRDCEVRAFCQQCPARAQLEHGPGAVSERVDWLCEMAHLRAAKLRMTEGVER